MLLPKRLIHAIGKAFLQKKARRYIVVVGFALIGILSQPSTSYSQVFMDASGAKLGEIARNGLVKNSSGKKIGVIEFNGRVTDGSDMPIGEFENNGIVRNASGSRIGEVKRNGVITNEYGVKLGEVDMYGNVLDASGTKIGMAPRVNPKSISAFYFFFNPDKAQ